MSSETEKERAGSSAERGHPDPNSDVGRMLTALRGLRFGVVTAIVQDGVVVQIERTEKFRVGRSAGAGS